MLKIILTDIKENVCQKSDFVSLRFSSSADTPCDALDIVFDGVLTGSEYKKIKMTYDGKTMFDGVVDVETVEYGNGGITTRIQARSNAALLVDNACIPCSYNMPSTVDLYEKHVKKYGISNSLPMLAGEYAFDVSIGDSAWSVINRFLKSISSLHLRLNAQNELTVLENIQGKKIVFSNTLQGCQPFESVKIRTKRAGIISKVTYKIDAENNYIYHSDCVEMKEKGVDTVRCINLAELEDYRRRERVKNIITDSAENYFSVTLVLPYIIQAPIGTKADFFDKKAGSFSDMTVCSVDIQARPSGSKSTVVLKRFNAFTEEKYVD